VRRAADRYAVEVDRGGVDRARQSDLLANERARVRRGDSGRVRIVVAAPGVPAEPCPVVTGACDRLASSGDATGQAPAASAAGEQNSCDENQS
jgi:hypothetical protein